MAYKYFSQREYGFRYDGGTCADSGCGPTSCAMLAYNFNKKWTPRTVADWETDHGHATCGTEWGGITAFFKANGMECIQYGGFVNQYGKNGGEAEKAWKKKIQQSKIKTGILLMGASMFTTGGHYIVIRKIKKQKDGTYKYLVWDPYTRGFCRWMTWSAFAGEVKQFYWVDATHHPKTSFKSLDGFKCGKFYTAKDNRLIRPKAKKSASGIGKIKAGEKVKFKKLHRSPAYLWGKTDMGWVIIKRVDANEEHFK